MERQTVPVASGKVNVLAAVKSAVVMVPVKLFVAIPLCGKSAIESALDVVELNVAALLVVNVDANAPDVCVIPVILERAPALLNLCVLFVCKAPPTRFTVPLKAAVPAVKVWVSLPKAIVVSVPPDASNVQVIPLPDPNVVVPISVVSRLSVIRSGLLVTVSIPFVPPTTLTVFPDVIASVVPESPVKLQLA